MHTILNNQRGAVAVLFWIMLVVIIAFAGLAVDVGAWFVARAELSKSVDAGALAGAKNISNPFADALAVAEEFAHENFRGGGAWTVGAPTFNASQVDNFRISVDGSVNTQSYFANVFGVNVVVVNNSAIAKKNAVEIMLVLDRSGSMAGEPIRDLKAAANSFVSFFEDTQAEDNLGLISFATGVTVNVPLQNNFVGAMRGAINSMNAVGATNAEDALDRADGSSGFTNQSGLPGDQRRQQYLIFFSDGNPTAFRGSFRYNGEDDIEAVACGTGQNCGTVYERLGNPDSENWLTRNGNYIDPRLTGDGMPLGGSSCGNYGNLPPSLTTRWYVFDNYPVAGGTPPACYIPTVNTAWSSQLGRYVVTSVTGRLAAYVCTTARQMAREHAQELQDSNIVIYTIGLGDVDRNFLEDIASGPSFAYYTPDSDELLALFNTIAKDIKLRLVQ